jgi:hypothetical protein
VVQEALALEIPFACVPQALLRDVLCEGTF